MAETCPTCGRDDLGCSVHDVGAFCRSPPPPPPSSAAKPNPDRPRVVTFDLPVGGRIEACRSCGAKVVWIQLPTGSRMPVNLDSRESHFATCPQADQWRRKKR